MNRLKAVLFPKLYPVLFPKWKFVNTSKKLQTSINLTFPVLGYFICLKYFVHYVRLIGYAEFNGDVDFLRFRPKKTFGHLVHLVQKI